MSKCAIKRNSDGKITKVVRPDGVESKLYTTIAKHPLVKTTEEALDIYMNTYSKDMVAKQKSLDELFQGPDEAMFVHELADGSTAATYDEALRQSKEGEEIQVGFQQGHIFTPIITIVKNTNKHTEEGYVSSMIESGYLAPERVKVGVNYRYKAGGETLIAQALNASIVLEDSIAYLGVSGVKKDANTFELTKTKDKVTLLNKEGVEVTVSKTEIDNQTYEELQENYENADDIVTEREWEATKVPYRDGQLEINQAPPVRPEGELELRLLNFLSKLGVKTMSISKYMKNYKLRHGVSPSAVALADIANQVVAYSKGEISDLAEETAHFINEALPQEKVENVLRNIHKTQEWVEFNDVYRNLYKKEYAGEELEAIVRREVLGKIVAKILVGNTATPSQSETEQNIFQIVMQALADFFYKVHSVFKPEYSTELKQYLTEVENLVAAENISTEVDLDNLKYNKFRFYNISDSQDPANLIRKKAQMLAFKLQDVEKRLISSGAGAKTRAADLGKVQKELDHALEVESLSAIIAVVNSSVRHVEASIKDSKAKNKPYFLDSEENIIYQSIKGISRKTIEDINVLLQTLKAQEKTNKWDTLIQESANTIARITTLETKARLIESTNVKRLVDSILDKYNIREADRDSVTKWIDKAEHDTNLFHATFGQLVHSKDGLLNLQGYIIKDMSNYQQVRYYESVKKLQDKLKELGVSERDLAKFVEDGGQHILSEYDFAEFEAQTEAIYLKTYMDTIKDSMPKLEAEIARYRAITNPTVNEVEALKELERKVGVYKSYETLTAEELKQKKVEKDLEMFSSEEENIRKNKERPLITPLIERAMKDSYYDEYEKKLKAANISDITKQQLSNYLGDVSYFKKKALKRVNGVLIMDFNTLTESEKVRMSELHKRRKYMKSYTNDIGKLKPGLNYRVVNSIIQTDANNKPIVEVGDRTLLTDESIVALDLNKLDGEFTGDERDSTKAGLFFLTLNKIDEEEGRESALNFLKLNSYMSFNGGFWDNLKTGASIADRLRNEVEVDPSEQANLNNLINNITRSSHELKSILRMFNAKGNPAEIEVEFMSPSSRNTVKMLQEEIRGYLMEANQLLGEQEADDADIEYAQGISDVNESYNKELKDLGLNEEPGDTAAQSLSKAIQEVDFAKEHMVTYNTNLMETIKLSITNYREGHRAGVHSAVQKELDNLGYDIGMLQDDAIHATILRNLTRGKVLPYYKRFTPEAYTTFREALENPQTNLANLLLNDPITKAAFVEVTPNYTFFNSEDNAELNPAYDKDFKGGYLQPKLSKFKNKKFGEMFGSITKMDDGTTVPEKNHKEYQAYQAMLEFNDDSLKAMNVGETYNNYLLPQVRKSKIERFIKYTKGNPIQTTKNFVKDVLTYTEDEMVQGEQMFGQDVKVIPKMYVNKLENPEDISTQLFHSLALRAKEAYGREAKVKYYGDLMSVHDKILTRDMNGKDPAASNTYKMAKSAIDYSLFGIKETATYPVKTPFGVIDLTKIARLLLSFIKFRNLGFNIIIPITSLLTGEVTRRIEMIVGEHIDTRSQTLGTREYRRLVGQGMKEIGKINTEAKLNALGQFFKAFDLNDSFNDSNYGYTLRNMPRTGMMLHSAANYPIYGKTMLGILHDFRVVDGTVLNKNDFKRMRIAQNISKKEIESEWKTYEGEVLYKYIKHEGNKVSFNKEALSKVLLKDGVALTEEEMDTAVDSIFSNVENNISIMNSYIDGQIPEEDRVLAQRHYLLSYFMTHRGWLSIAISRRFKNRHLNLQTRVNEEGSYRSLWNFAGDFFKEWRATNFTKFIGSSVKTWKEGDELQRRNMNRVLIESSALATIMILALGLRYAAEDDDNEDLFALQLTNHLTYRTMNELSSVQLNIVSNFSETIESPFVGWNTVKNLADIAQVFSGEEVSSGTYKGMTERGRWLTKMTPGAKQYFDLQHMNKTYDTYRFYNRKNFTFTPANVLWLNTIDKKNKD